MSSFSPQFITSDVFLHYWTCVLILPSNLDLHCGCWNKVVLPPLLAYVYLCWTCYFTVLLWTMCAFTFYLLRTSLFYLVFLFVSFIHSLHFISSITWTFTFSIFTIFLLFFVYFYPDPFCVLLRTLPRSLLFFTILSSDIFSVIFQPFCLILFILKLLWHFLILRIYVFDYVQSSYLLHSW